DPSGIPAASREYAEELLQLAAKRSGVLLSEVRGQRVLPALVTISTERSPAASPARGGGTGTRSSETEPEVPSVTAPGYQ
ncbi:hypothetical protein JG663_18620, partial [Vibrio cholerae]|uniref:hypothetical protein n=1 Tax=Vibrio cholerae TaxID=666 RepID=UPI0018F09E3E